MKQDKKISAIIFDFDNTLVNSWPVLYKSFVNTLKYFNKEIPTLNEVKDRMHASLRTNFPEIFGDDWEHASSIYYENYRKYASEIMPFEDAENLLMAIKEFNIPCIIISNKRGDLLRNEISKKLKWDKYFDLVIGSKDTKEDKPSIIPVNYAAEKLNLELDDRVWFIGDSDSDIQCAINSGCKPILFDSSNKKYIKSELDFLHFDTHDEINKYLRLNLL